MNCFSGILFETTEITKITEITKNQKECRFKLQGSNPLKIHGGCKTGTCQAICERTNIGCFM